MRVYHRTPSRNVAKILKNGFRDATGTYMTGRVFTGVWFSDRPLDTGCIGGRGWRNQGTLLAIELPDKVFKKYEWLEDGKAYRDSLITAKIVNRYGAPKLISEDEEAELEKQKTWLSPKARKERDAWLRGHSF